MMEEVKPQKRPRRRKKAKIELPKEPVGVVDFDKLAEQSNPQQRTDWIQEQVRKPDYFSISDAMVNRSRGGHPVLAEFEMNLKAEAEQRKPVRMWKIKVLKHEDGRDVSPGDEITWVQQRYHKRNFGRGKNMTAQEAMEMVARGQGNQVTQMGSAVLDEHCCIDLPYKDAAQLLSKNGIYYATGYPLNPAMPEKNRLGRPNWLYVEVPPGSIVYEKQQPEEEPSNEPDIRIDS